MRKFLLLLSLCFAVLLFTFNYSIKAWTLDNDLETFPVAEENPPLPTQVFLPMISGNQTANSTAVGSSDTTWTRYEATYYSFLYPDERKVEEQNDGQSYWASNYYIWLCGRGGTPDDDSVYMGVNDASPSSAQRITGYDQSVWVWKSIKMDGQRPYMYLPGSLPVVNLWAREDGMRVDRILLTRDVNYNPTGNIRCGGY